MASGVRRKRNDGIVGTANGGTAYSVNYDDGTLNFNRGLASSVAKITSELEVNYKDFGFFARGTYFYDFELEDDDRLRTPLSQGALNRSGSDGDVLDALLYYRFKIGGMPAEFRIGEQVVNWGESTFIQGGNNVINHFNVSALRVPGAELREALLAQDLAWFSISPSDALTVELVYQYDWDDTEPEGVGTFFSSNDFASDGGQYVRLGFGDTPDTPNPRYSDPTRPFNAIPRGMGQEPDDGGQYGFAVRYYAEDFNNGTEFGFYFYNYHSRLPLLSARSGTTAGLVAAASIGASAGAGGASDIANAAAFRSWPPIPVIMLRPLPPGRRRPTRAFPTLPRPVSPMRPSRGKAWRRSPVGMPPTRSAQLPITSPRFRKTSRTSV